MNKKVDEEFKNINDVYVLQCICTELKELCDKYEEEHNITFKEWQKDIQANKKAIEYINTNEILNVWGEYKPFKEFGYGKDLLNILQGSDK